MSGAGGVSLPVVPRKTTTTAATAAIVTTATAALTLAAVPTDVAAPAPAPTAGRKPFFSVKGRSASIQARRSPPWRSSSRLRSCSTARCRRVRTVSTGTDCRRAISFGLSPS
ncbi:MAG: hypothetical protein ACYTDY_02925 [Planctomycetota bacterium]